MSAGLTAQSAGRAYRRRSCAKGADMDARTTAPDRYLVISADMHGGATVQGYRPYLATRWHDEFDEWAATTPSRWVEATTPKRRVAVGTAIFG